MPAGTSTIPSADLDSAYNALSAVPAFSGLSDQTRRLLAEKARPVRVPRGAVLVRQGESADDMFIVVAGRFTVAIQNRDGIIAEIGPGEPIGELSFFGRTPRSATVTAARDSDVLLLTREILAEITPAAPELLSVILASVARRLSAVAASAPAIRRKPPRVVGLLPIAPGVSARDIAHRIKAGLEPHRAALISADRRPGEEIAAAIDAAENAADLVLCPIEADPAGRGAETLRHCDELILLATGPSAAVHRAQAAAAELFRKEHRTLVLVRDRADAPIAGTAAWLQGRDVALHHHVALDRPADFKRLGRFLLGKAVGLVLGGGAAYGCAHLGVARALNEAGVPLDFFGGTSVGAAMAAALATGTEPDAILDQTEEIFVHQGAMRRLTLPIHGVLDHSPFDGALRHHYGPGAIEDLPFNYYAVSATLTGNDMHVHRRGPVWEAIRASSAIPGVLPPFITAEGDVLVDGAVVDNVPVNVMRDLKLGPNVVVSFTRPQQWRVAGKYAELPSRGALLRDLMLRRKRDYPTLVTVLLKSMFLASARLPRAQAPGDLFVIPDLPSGIGLLDWRRGREIASAAHRQMATLLESAPEAQEFLQAKVEALVSPSKTELALIGEPATNGPARKAA